MMLEMNRPWATPQKIEQLLLQSRTHWPIAPPLAAAGKRRGPLGQSNRPAIGDFQLVFVQAPLQRQPQHVRGILPAQLFFFYRKQNGMLVDQRHRRASSQRGDAEYVHEPV